MRAPFLFVDPGVVDEAFAKQAFSALGIEIDVANFAVPTYVVDTRHPEAQLSALRKAMLAFMDMRLDIPIVTVERGLRVRSLQQMPGTGVQLVSATCGPSAMTEWLDRTCTTDRRCVFEIGVAYYDGASEFAELAAADRGPTRKMFSRHVNGTIATMEQLHAFDLEVTSVEDLFIPENMRLPFSRLPEERRNQLSREFESIYIDLAEWLSEVDAERHRARMASVRRAFAPVPAPELVPEPPRQEPTYAHASARAHAVVVVEDVPTTHVLDGEHSGGSAGSYRTVRDPQSTVARETVVRVGDPSGRQRRPSGLTQIGIAPVGGSYEE